MKTLFLRLVLGVILAYVTWAATEQQKLDAINNGLANLYATQQGVGYWSYFGKVWS